MSVFCAQVELVKIKLEFILSCKNVMKIRIKSPITKHACMREHPNSSKDDLVTNITQLVTIQL